MKKFVGSVVRNRIQDWENIHDQGVRSRYGVLEGWVSIGVNLVLFILKGGLGMLTGSVALIADGFHTLSDVSTSVVIVASFKMAEKPSDASNPFGHGRMEAIATVVVAVLLVVVGIEVFKGAVGRILHPRGFNASWWIVGIIFFTVVIKELLARFSRELGRMIGSTSLEADFWHHRSDAISSVLVILAFLGQRLGIPHLDGVVGVAVAGMIVYSGWEVARRGMDDLLGKKPSDELVRSVKSAVWNFPDVLGVHDLVVHEYGQVRVMSFHIQVSDDLSLKEAHTLAERVARVVNEKFRTYTTVHLDPINTQDPEVRKVREFLLTQVDQKKALVSFHDLRVVGDEDSRGVTFDLVVDPTLGSKEAAVLRQGLEEAVLKTFPWVRRVIVEIEPKYAV